MLWKTKKHLNLCLLSVKSWNLIKKFLFVQKKIFLLNFWLK